MEKTDEEYIKAYIEGDQSSFRKIVDKYTDCIYIFLYRLYQDPIIAEDATQETFVKVWKNIKKFKPEANFKTWIFTIARNTAIDIMRKKKDIVFSQLINSDDKEINFFENIPDTAPIPDEIFEKASFKKDLEEILNTLDVQKKMIVLLHDIDDLTFEEIALIVNKPMNTVKSHYRRAILALKDKVMHQKL